MTNADLKKIINESLQVDLYNQEEFKFDFPYINFSKTFIGITAAYTFVNQQLKGWKSIDDIPVQFNNSITYFTLVRDSIIAFANVYPNQDLPNIQPYIASIKQAISNVRTKPFIYNFPEVHFLIKVNTDFPNSFASAYAVIVGEVNYPLLSSKESLIGIMMAYEFIQKDTSKIVERRNAEKKTMTSLRNDFINYISETEEEATRQIEDSEKRYAEQLDSIIEIKNERATLIDEWFESSKILISNFHTKSTENITALENTYEELIRLKKPADYWKERALELKKEGDHFFYWLIGLVGFAVVTLYLLLWLTPEGMQKTFFNDDRSLAIRWSVIYITFISFLFFATKAVMKSMFSTYHLSRDAEERQRLTYVYLAMIKDSSIEKEDRHLVMQSLFSRAETGLLKEDSSPSMPGTGGFIDIIKK